MEKTCTSVQNSLQSHPVNQVSFTVCWCLFKFKAEKPRISSEKSLMPVLIQLRGNEPRLSDDIISPLTVVV